MSNVSAIIIREANKNDVTIIQQLAHKIWPVSYGKILSANQLKYMLDLIYSESSLQKQIEDDHHFLMVEVNKQPIAFADYSLLKDAIFKLNKIYALPSEQGKGIGKLLLNDVIKRVKEKGATTLLLNVNRNNKAKQFYEHLGFKVISEEDIDIGEGYFMNDYIMSLNA